MKDYKRLTERDDSLCTDCADIGFCRKTCISQARYERLQFLENEIESGEIDYVADSKTEQTITDLLIEFDEMGFAPTTVCPNLEQYATEWRERVRKEFACLTAENQRLREEVAEQKSIAEHEHATQMEWFMIACDYKAEAAAPQKRLDNTVELPCKIGDEVYEVHGKCDGKNCPYNGDYGQWRCSYGGKRNCNSFITVNKFCYSDIPRVGKTIFVTKKAAEARLKERKENNNDNKHEV